MYNKIKNINKNVKGMRYLIVSIISFFILVAGVSATGVFYFDAAANQFVMDSKFIVSDPSSFKLLLREVNASNDEVLYINGRKDFQLRIDNDNDSVSSVKFNNGSNNTVLSATETGVTKIGADVSDATKTFATLAQSGLVVGPAGVISGSGSLTAQSSSSGNVGKVVLNPTNVIFPQVDGSGNPVVIANGAISAENLNTTNLSIVNFLGKLTLNGGLTTNYDRRFHWGGASFGHMSTATARYGGSGAFVWYNTSGSNIMALGDNGNLWVNGKIYAGGVELGKAPVCTPITYYSNNNDSEFVLRTNNQGCGGGHNSLDTFTFEETLLLCAKPLPACEAL